MCISLECCLLLSLIGCHSPSPLLMLIAPSENTLYGKLLWNNSPWCDARGNNEHESNFLAKRLRHNSLTLRNLWNCTDHKKGRNLRGPFCMHLQQITLQNSKIWIRNQISKSTKFSSPKMTSVLTWILQCRSQCTKFSPTKMTSVLTWILQWRIKNAIWMIIYPTGNHHFTILLAWYLKKETGNKSATLLVYRL
jgi:hypothetical protein